MASSSSTSASFATLPRRSAPSTPGPSSGASTPARGISHSRSLTSTFLSPASPANNTPPTRESIYARLTRRVSHSQHDADGTISSSVPTASSAWKDAKYRDAVERAQREGNAESWQVLLKSPTAAQQSGTGAASSASGGGGLGESPSAAASGGVAGGSGLRRKLAAAAAAGQGGSTSTGTVAGSSQISTRRQGNDSSLSSLGHDVGASLVEEPDSYAHLDEDEEDDDACHGRRSHDESERLLPTADSPDEGDDDDTSSSSTNERIPRTTSSICRAYHHLFPLSAVSKNVLKCVVAYFIGELFTFVPFLTDFLGSPWDVDGPVRNAHVVATVAVYFYPARTIGSMLEAILFMLMGACYATFLCCGSMAMSVAFDRIEQQNIGHALVLIVWLGGGYGVLAYFKTTVNKPTFTTACSMVSLIASVIITKEGAYHIGAFKSQAILQVLLLVAIGTTISTIVCFVLWPTSATSKLQSDLNKTLSSFSTLFNMLTGTFLLDDDMTTSPEALKRAIDAHQSSFTTLKSSLAQAKFEIFESRMSATTSAYQDAIENMTRLAQGLTGMRASCTLQHRLIRAREDGWFDEMEGNGNEKGLPRSEEEEAERAKLRGEMLVLERFKERVGPSMKALTRTSTRALAHLRTSFVRTRAGSVTRHAIHHHDDPEAASDLLSSETLLKIKEELSQTLLLFKREHSRAVTILYRSLPAQTMYSESDLQNGIDSDPFADPNRDDEGPNGDLFRIFHFCFNAEEWTLELINLVESFVEIRTTEEEVERKIVDRKRKWGVFSVVAKVLGGIRWRGKRRRGRGTRTKATLGQRASTLLHQTAGIMKPSSSPSSNPFPTIVDGALTSHQFPASELTVLGRLKQSIWILGYRLRQPDVRFAIKTGLGAAVLGCAAFITALRPYWLEMRGEWSLISYMVIMAPTLGGTNFLAMGRVLGTLAGALLAVASYLAFPENAIVLPLLGALVSVPCFYVIVTRPQYGPSSRFVLLTFNLTCLYAFNLREVDTHVGSIALHRSVAVAGGVIYGLLVNTWIWPYEARRELRKGLSEYFLNAAYLYERLVRTYSIPPPSLLRAHRAHHAGPAHANETTALLSDEAKAHLSQAEDEFVAMEVNLQLSLIKLSGLLAATAHEPRLKGPFPVAEYRIILTSCQTILDLLTSIQHVTTREAWYSSVRRDFVVPVNRERREMVGNVILYFSLLASALTLKTPLPAFLPPAAEAQAQLEKKLRDLEVVKKRIVRGGSEGLLYLGYALSMKDVIAQLDLLGATFQRLFGIIGGAKSTDEFESLFRSHELEEGLEGHSSSGGASDDESV